MMARYISKAEKAEKVSNSSTIPAPLLRNYLQNLINLFFKILPLREENEQSLPTYIDSFQAELIGADSLMAALGYDHTFMSLLSVLQYLKDNPTADVKVVRREVFKCINFCKKLSEKYASQKEA